jgi:nitrite reductase/ring-hydroxylating ferredoxin subunit
MHLSKLVATLPIEPQPGEHWAVLGPEAGSFLAGFSPAVMQIDSSPHSAAALDGLVLAGALSAELEAAVWLKQVVGELRDGATLVVIEWQGDGPIDVGPDLERRFKRGKLCRLLRESGFGRIALLSDHPIYYIIQASKVPPAVMPHAGEFVTVARVAELTKNAMKQVELFGRQIIVANTGREIVAFAPTCPHAGTSLIKGKLKGRLIMCPLHFYMWNVCTGEPIEPPDEDILRLFPVKIDYENDLIQVALVA